MEKVFLNDLLTQNIHTCSFTFKEIADSNVSYRLNPKAASVGFIYRHIGESMLMFGYFFGLPVDVENTTLGKQDEGQGSKLESSRQLIDKGYEMLRRIIEQTSAEAWLQTVETPFFGSVSRARLFAHILYHNAYHAGQIGLTLKRASGVQ